MFFGWGESLRLGRALGLKGRVGVYSTWSWLGVERTISSCSELMNSHNIILTSILLCQPRYLSRVQVFGCILCFALVYQYIYFESSTEVDSLQSQQSGKSRRR